MADYDPYRPPQATLIDETLPAAFAGGDWAPAQLRVLGALALGFAFGLGVLLALSLWQLFYPQPAPLVVVHMLKLSLVLLWGYLLLRLAGLLACRFALRRGLAWPLLLQVAPALLATGFGAWLDQGGALPADWLEPGKFALCVLLGLSLLGFALRVLRVRRGYPALRPFAWLLLLAGAACASVVLLLPALLLALAASVALAWVFFAAAGELPQD